MIHIILEEKNKNVTKNTSRPTAETKRLRQCNKKDYKIKFIPFYKIYIS